MRCDALVLETGSWLEVGYHLGANPVARVIVAGQLVEPAASWAASSAGSVVGIRQAKPSQT